jgi:hypothetical protein
MRPPSAEWKVRAPRLAARGAIACVLLACSARPAPPAPAPVASVAPRIVPLPARGEAGDELIVGSSRGLEAWRRDGKGRRLVSAGAALHPRWLDAGTVLVLRPERGEDLAGGARLERISLPGGARTEVAALPPLTCAGEARPRALVLDDWTGFALNREQRRACVDLTERAGDLTFRVKVSLESGAIKRRLTGGADARCEPPPGVEVARGRDDEPCFPDEAGGEAAAAPFPYRIEEGQVLFTGDGVPRQVMRLEGYEENGGSPSGAWALLAGDFESDGEEHERLVLLDRSTGRVFPIRGRAGPWPAPLRGVGKRPARVSLPISETIRVPIASGGADVRWLGPPDAELLVVGGDLVVRPGAATFSVSGQLAR